MGTEGVRPSNSTVLRRLANAKLETGIPRQEKGMLSGTADDHPLKPITPSNPRVLLLTRRLCTRKKSPEKVGRGAEQSVYTATR
jgi:hypothetical protein